MSETVPRELMVLVERVVRPLPLCVERQRRLRAEMLEHLQAIFTEELAHDGDHAAALARTAERFGDLSEIKAELRQTIHPSERFTAWLQKLMAQRSGESVTHYVGRVLAAYLGMFAPLLAMVMIVKHFSGEQPLTLGELRLFAGLMSFLGCWMGGFLWCGLHFGREWDRSQKRWARLTFWAVCLVLVWPLGLSLQMEISGGHWTDYGSPKISLGTMFLAGSLISLVFGVFVGIAHQRETRYRHEWEELVLESA